MIRATASAAALRPTARHATTRRRIVLVLLLLTVLALVSAAAVGQRAAAAETGRDDIRVSADGVAFEGGSESDELTYVVRSVDSNDSRSYSRDLTPDEQDSGWAAFREARQAYPDGYCVVWVEVEDASNWHETGNSTVCYVVEQAATPTPTPTPKKNGKAPPTPTASPTPAQPEAVPTPTPSPSPTPSPTPSATASSTPAPSPSHTSPEAALLQSLRQQSVAKAQGGAAEEDEVISPRGWVAVLGGGALLTAGGALVLWRRLT